MITEKKCGDCVNFRVVLWNKKIDPSYLIEEWAGLCLREGPINNGHVVLLEQDVCEEFSKKEEQKTTTEENSVVFPKSVDGPVCRNCENSVFFCMVRNSRLVKQDVFLCSVQERPFFCWGDSDLNCPCFEPKNEEQK